MITKKKGPGRPTMATKDKKVQVIYYIAMKDVAAFRNKVAKILLK